MTKYHEPTLESLPNYWPVLIPDAFNANGQFLEFRLQEVIIEYLVSHIQRAVTKKGSSPETVLNLLIKEIRAEHIGKDMYSSLDGDVSEGLSAGKPIRIESSFDGMAILNLKRFGRCLGIRPVDGCSNKHELGAELLESIAQSKKRNGLRNLSSFNRTWIITMSRSRAYGGPRIDVAAELASAARYAPDVEWMENADGAIAKLLEDDYIAMNHWYGGVEVGRYHGIPIRMRVLFGDEKSSKNWRRGAVMRSGTTLSFQSQSADFLYICYGAYMADESDVYEIADRNIDYVKEQRCLEVLSTLLLNAFLARNLAETIVDEPHQVAWKLKEPQAETTTV